jgi:hypothetical protein
VLLFTILIDNKTHPAATYWSLLYDILLDDEPLELILEQAQKLVSLSRTMKTWASSKYYHILRIVNTETLEMLHNCWQKYVSICEPATNQREMQEAKVVLSATDSLMSRELLTRHLQLTKSFGALTKESSDYSMFHSKGFWWHGAYGLYPLNKTKVNPLLIYSAASGDCNALWDLSLPSTGLHCASGLAPLSESSPNFVATIDPPDILMPKAFPSFAIPAREFSNWCESFKKVASNPTTSKRIRFRFFVGDSMSLCYGFAKVSRPGGINPLHCYPHPTNGVPLVLDGAGYLPNAAFPAPLSFNVIDASDLGDSSGLLNIFVSAIPLLTPSPSTILFTESHIQGKDDLGVLQNMLLGDVGSICTLVGIAPLTYMTGVSARGYEQDIGIGNYHLPVSNYIAWRYTTSGDPAVNIAHATPSYLATDLADLLHNIYKVMFFHETALVDTILEGQERTDLTKVETFRPLYTRRSFAALVAFLKPRIQVDWNEVMKLLDNLIPCWTPTKISSGSPFGSVIFRTSYGISSTQLM